MKKIKATKNGRYAQSKPYLPQITLISDCVYCLEDSIADRIVELEGASYFEEASQIEIEASQIESNFVNTKKKRKK